jgi:hypothetical protein
MLDVLEARCHRLHKHPVEIGSHTAVTIAGPVLCGFGGCGDELAQVVLVPFDLSWGVDVSRHYSQQPDGHWRWRQHSPRTYRPTTAAPWSQIVTSRGDLIMQGPSGTHIRRGAAIHAASMKRVAYLHPGEFLVIGCRRKSPHVSLLSYERLMREAIIDERLMPASS